LQTAEANTASGPAIPLARWADRQLRILAEETGSPGIAALRGATILGERGSHGNYVISGRVSPGLGGSRIMPTRDGRWFVLTIIRAEDRVCLPALLLDEDLDIHDPDAIAAGVARHDCDDIVERGRLLGLPVAALDETPASPPSEVMVHGSYRQRPPGHRPLVIDMSAIWAGPLLGHLLWLAGAELVKIESPTRPDLIRRDDPATFDLINQGKANISIDLTRPKQKAALIDLIRRADFVVESSRVRALKQLGVDAEALVRKTPGLVWLSVTGHGATGEAANWAGIGHDCGVAGGLSQAMVRACGEVGYVGDAIADPLTGIAGAIEAWRAYRSGKACRIGLAMSAITARALREEREHDSAALEAELCAWGAAVGSAFPKVPRRELSAPVRPLGADTARYVPAAISC
jgi:hypothetical protein